MAKRVNVTLDFGNNAGIENLKAPTSANDAARKADVDAVQTSLRFMENPVRAVATANVNLAAPPANIDGVALTAGVDRVLLTGQTAPIENGTYIYGAPLVRTADAFSEGTVVFANNDGVILKNTLWIQTTTAPNPGVTALTFNRLPFEASSAGAGLDQSGNVISLHIPVSVANGGTGGTTPAAAKTSLGFVTTYEQDFGDGAATSFNVPHNLGNQFCSVVVTNKTTGADEDCAITRTDVNNLVLSSEAWAATPPANGAYHVACRG